MRVLVCGSRDWTDRKILDITLSGMLYSYNRLMVIEGEAPGADTLARLWAEEKEAAGLPVGLMKFPADWVTLGKAAGAIRNAQMLEEGKPAVVIAFKDSFDWSLRKGGTEDMIKQTIAAKIPYYVTGRK